MTANEARSVQLTTLSEYDGKTAKMLADLFTLHEKKAGNIAVLLDGHKEKRNQITALSAKHGQIATLKAANAEKTNRLIVLLPLLTTAGRRSNAAPQLLQPQFLVRRVASAAPSATGTLHEAVFAAPEQLLP